MLLPALLVAAFAGSQPPAPIPGPPSLSARAAADTIRGRVTDPEGGPVKGARVTVVELSSVVETAADGGFAIAVPTGRYTLLIEAPGFAVASREVPAHSAGDVGVALEPKSFTLDPVNVTVTRQPLDLASSPLPVSSLGEDALRREHGVSVAQAVSSLAGVHAVTTGEQIGKPVMRGLSGPRVLVLENGHRLEDYSWSDEDGPSIESRLEQRIEVIRGPASVLYGSDAIGGVINAVPRPLPRARAGGSLGRAEAEVYAASNNREFGTALRYEGAAGMLGWRAFVVGRRGEDIHTPIGELENTGFGAVSGELTLGLHTGAGTSTLRYSRYGGEFKLLEASGPVPGTGPEEDEGEEGPERKLEDDRIQFDGNYALGRGRLETKAQWQRHVISELSDDLAEPGGPVTETEVFNLALNTWTGDALFHHGGGDLIGTVGGSVFFQDNDTRGEVPLVPDARIRSLAAFVFEQVDLGRVRLLGGARAEHRSVDADANMELGLADESRDYTVAVGNVGAVFEATEAVSLTGNVGRAWRAPNLFELFANGPRLGEGRYELGDADMTEETSLNLDASIRLDLPRVHGAISGYRNDFGDYIFVSPTDRFIHGLRVFQYSQADATLLGAEASVEVLPADAVTLRGRFDVVRATNEDLDEPLPLIPARYGAVEVELHGGRGGWVENPYVGLETEIVASKTRLAPSEEQLPGYALFNVEAGFQHLWGSRRLRLDLRVRNLFDREYTDFLSRYKEFAPDPGRNIVLRLSTTL